MMYGTSSIRIFIFDPKVNKDVQVTINFDKHLQKHPGITCSGCKTSILGIRYICKTCEDYDLCEACKNNKIHSHHPFALMPSKFGFPVCNECDKEITTTYCCQECTDKKVGQINSALASERLKKGKPVRYEHISWIVCDDCRLRNHNGHPFVTESVLELNKQQQELINELMNAKKNGEERKVYPGIKCSSCSKDGVRFKSTSFKYEKVFLCEQCLTEGVFKNLLSLIKLTDADYYVLIKEERKKQKMASMYGTYASRNVPHMKTAFDTNKVYSRNPLGIQQRHSPPNYDRIPQVNPSSAFVGYPQNFQNAAFGHATANGPVQGFGRSAGFKPPHNRVIPYI